MSIFSAGQTIGLIKDLSWSPRQRKRRRSKFGRWRSFTGSTSSSLARHCNTCEPFDLRHLVPVCLPDLSDSKIPPSPSHPQPPIPSLVLFPKRAIIPGGWHWPLSDILPSYISAVLCLCLQHRQPLKLWPHNALKHNLLKMRCLRNCLRGQEN